MVIISSKPGQLGNSLLLFSHFIAFGLENKIKIINPAFDTYSAYFPETEKDFFQRFPSGATAIKSPTFRKWNYKFINLFARALNRLRINNFFLKTISLDWGDRLNLDEIRSINALKESRFVFALGWGYRSDELVRKHFQNIHHFFRPNDFHLTRIENFISQARKDCDVLIGVHIRLGDYKSFEGGKYFYSLTKYREFLERVKKLFPGKRIKFLICTNTKESFEVFNDTSHILGLGHELEDMYLFSKCDYLIGPPSTYTMWASFYGKVPLCMIHESEKDFSLADFIRVTHEKRND
jgi:hypothetical protein